MARRKTRAVRDFKVDWYHKGTTIVDHSEPIVAARIMEGTPAPWPGDCWICRNRVDKGAGHVLRVDTKTHNGAAALQAQIHAGCIDPASARIRLIRRGAIDPQPDPTETETDTETDTDTQENTTTMATIDPSTDKAAAVAALLEILGGNTAPIDRDEVKRIVLEEMAEGSDASKQLADAIKIARELQEETRPVIIIRDVKAGTEFKVEGAHEMLPELMRLLECEERIAWLVGPTGTGKTYLAEQAAKALGVRCFVQSCFGQSAQGLVGRPTVSGGFVGTAVTMAVDETRRDGSPGAMLVMDEADRADECALVALHSLFNGQGLATPARDGMPVTCLGPAPLYIVFTTNTLATSYGNREYNAATKLDDATLNRIDLAQVWVDYDKGLERAYVKATGLPDEVASALWKIRAGIRKHKLEQRHVSTRAFKILGNQHRAHGEHWGPDVLIERVIGQWTDEEREKIGYPREAN